MCRRIPLAEIRFYGVGSRDGSRVRVQEARLLTGVKPPPVGGQHTLLGAQHNAARASTTLLGASTRQHDVVRGSTTQQDAVRGKHNALHAWPTRHLTRLAAGD
jgi:hypothetical protein